MRTQTFGVEIEMTGVTRKKAAEVAAEYFGTTAVYAGGTYKKYTVSDGTGRQWSFVYDSSIRVESKNGRQAEQVEMVTPILNYEDLARLQDIIRLLRKNGIIIKIQQGTIKRLSRTICC